MFIIDRYFQVLFSFLLLIFHYIRLTGGGSSSSIITVSSLSIFTLVVVLAVGILPCCCGTATATVNGGTGAYFYSWNDNFYKHTNEDAEDFKIEKSNNIENKNYLGTRHLIYLKAKKWDLMKKQ